MFKNVAGQFVGVQMVSASDGTAFSGTVTVYVTVDNGTQTIGSVGSGVCTHKGNGLHNYAPSQAETNGSSIQFTFIGTGAIPQTIQLETLPTTGVLAPTVANRTLDVSSGGEAGIDLANVGSPTTTLNLSGLTIKNSTDVKTIVDLIYTVVQLTDASVSTMPVDTRDAILNRVLAGNHSTSGTVGLLLQFLDALISSRLAPATAGRTLTVSADGKANAELDSASRAAILTEQLIESYAADGAAPTVAQALMMLLQHHQQKSVSGTTVTIKKLDKSTTASTYTLDSATDPTSITRAT